MNELLRAIVMRLECIATLLADQQGRSVGFSGNGWWIDPKPTGDTYRAYVDGVLRAEEDTPSDA